VKNPSSEIEVGGPQKTLMRPIKHLRASFAIAVNNLTTTSCCRQENKVRFIGVTLLKLFDHRKSMIQLFDALESRKITSYHNYFIMFCPIAN